MVTCKQLARRNSPRKNGGARGDYIGQVSNGGFENAVIPQAKLDLEEEKLNQESIALSSTAISIAKRSFNADSKTIKGIGSLVIKVFKLFYETEESQEGVEYLLIIVSLISEG